MAVGVVMVTEVVMMVRTLKVGWSDGIWGDPGDDMVVVEMAATGGTPKDTA